MSWLRGHAFTLYTIGLVAVVAAGLYEQNDRREADAHHARARLHDAWESDTRNCLDANARTVVLRKFLDSATAPPDPRQFEFIADPALRAGALAQATASRAALRAEAEVFSPRNCAEIYPEPPR